MKTLSSHTILIVLVALSAVLTGCQTSQCAYNNHSPKLMQSYVKTSGNSMEPTIKDGDILNVAAYPFEKLAHGDIVVYENRDGMLISHRIYRCTRNSWYAKGDNNPTRDPETVTRWNYRGLVYVEPEKLNKPDNINGRPINKIKRIVYTHSE